MIPLTFRFKLLMSMMLVVGGVSGVTLYITEKKVQEGYEKVFKEKLESQITYLPKEQGARLNAIREECQKLARSVRLKAALEEADADNLYKVVRDELKVVLRQEERSLGAELGDRPPPPRPPEADHPPRMEEWQRKGFKGKTGALMMFSNAMAARTLSNTKAPMRPPQRQPFLGILDAQGKVVPDPTMKSAAIPARKLFLDRIGKLGEVIGNLESQEVGYLDLELDSKINMLMEVILTPVADEDARKVLGALVFGVPYLDLGEQAISDVSDIDNGVYLDGRLFSHTIPKSTQQALKVQLPEEIRRFPEPREDFFIQITNVPHRVFYTPLNPGSSLPIAYKVGLYSWESAIKARRDVRVEILSFSALAMLGALVLSLLLSHGFAVPINELVAGTQQIREGKYDVKVRVRRRDEIGHLAASFNEMAQGLALKEKYASVLNKVADKDVAELLMAGKLTLGGEMREVSVLFCDIRGFTPLTQGMDPAEAIQMLNEHMTALTRVVTAHSGVVDKFIGDSIMACFGAPKSYGNDAHNAVRCGLRMIQERRKLNETSKYKIQIGIGIATGPVLAGNMGSEDRSNYTVIGERVNLASRLCSVAGRGEVVIGEFTREKLGNLVGVEEMPELRLKGFSESIRAYRLLEVHSLRAVQTA